MNNTLPASPISELRRGYVAHLNRPIFEKIRQLEAQADELSDRGDHAGAGRLLITADNYRLLLVAE